MNPTTPADRLDPYRAITGDVPVDSVAFLVRRLDSAKVYLDSCIATFAHDAATNPEYAVNWRLDDVIIARVKWEATRTLANRAADMTAIGDPDEAELVREAHRSVAHELIDRAHITQSSSALTTAMSVIETQAQIDLARRYLAGGW